ncbi:MAG: KDO2-lipid IV(A) lauroyltransferase, partial [Nonlabens sp.]
MYLVRILSRLPFWFLYTLAEVKAFFGYHILGYRRDVVRENLTTAFPDKSNAELRRITKAFYQQLSQVFVESIKAYRFTHKDWVKRVPLVNKEEVLAYLDQGVPVILMSGHVANWEWPAFSIGAQMGYPMEFLYKPVTKEKFENIMLKLRT